MWRNIIVILLPLYHYHNYTCRLSVWLGMDYIVEGPIILLNNIECNKFMLEKNIAYLCIIC